MSPATDTDTRPREASPSRGDPGSAAGATAAAGIGRGGPRGDVPAGVDARRVTEAATRLHAARQERRPVATLSSRWDGMTREDAYAVQAAGIDLRTAEGETIVGGKLGFTSAAMRHAMGVDSPNAGWLTDAMILHDGVARREDFIHPKVEPEIAFVLGEDLAAAATVEDVLRATSHVAACLEVVDSRYEGFRFGPLDNIADDSSAGGFVLGDPVPVGRQRVPGCSRRPSGYPGRPSGDDLDLRTLGIAVWADGVLHATAAGAACHGHPAAAVAWLANALPDLPALPVGVSRSGLRAGDIVISGGLTGPVDLTPGTLVTAEIDRIGAVSVRMPP